MSKTMEFLKNEDRGLYDFCIKEATKRSVSNSKYQMFLMSLNGMTQADIARRFNMSKENIRMHISRAYREMRSLYYASNDSLNKLELSTRAYNALWRSGIHTITEAVDYMKKNNGSLEGVRNAGKHTEKEIMDKLRSYNLI